MSHPKEAWKFKLWSEAMLRGATVGNPEYKGKSSSNGMTSSNRAPTRRRRRRRKSNRAKKEA